MPLPDTLKSESQLSAFSQGMLQQPGSAGPSASQGTAPELDEIPGRKQTRFASMSAGKR